MKFTQYFFHIRQRPDHVKIEMEWIEETVKNPDYTEVQSGRRIRKWKKIEEGKLSVSSCFQMDKQCAKKRGR